MRGRYWVLFVVLSTASTATADTLSATRDQDVTETQHSVDVEVRNGLAYYKVRRVFHNPGKIADEARLDIQLPYGAVATGLRIKGKDQWHEGELMHARKAEELYVELTGMGPSEPKDPALLYWRWTDQLALRVFPIFPGKSNTVEYTLTAPTTYSDGTYHLTYGRKPETKNLATPILRMRGKGVARFEVDGESTKRTVRLGQVRRHPVLIKSGIDNPKVLVRSLRVWGEDPWANVKVDINVRHTWRGDVSVSLVSPDGEVHSLRKQDLSDGENNLKTTFSFESGESPNGTWHLLVEDHHPLDGGTLTNWSLRSSTENARIFRDKKPAFIPQPTNSKAGLATIGVRFKGDASVVRLGRVDLLRDKKFARFEVDVARRLSSLPRPLSVSFVLDVSHTMDHEGIAAQLKLAEAYLGLVPWAEFSLVSFGRHARDLTGGFVPANQFRQVAKRLEKTDALKPRNGSFLDRGLQLAVPSLAKRRGSQALVMMTDDRLRPVWKNSIPLAELAKLPIRATVHVAEVATGGTFEIARNDEHRLFGLAKLRGGVAVNVGGVLGAKLSSLRDKVLYLVRPNRIDHVRLEGLKVEGESILPSGDGDGDGTVLHEGAGRRWIGQVTAAPTRASIRGQLWSKPVRYTAHANDEPFNQATAGFVFSHDLYQNLSEAEQFVLAMYARVVSPVTSYLAIEPGVRPSTIGLEHNSAGWGTIGSGSYGGAGMIGSGSKMNWEWVEKRVRHACRGLGGGRVSATLSLQSREIADIAVETSSRNTALESCVLEALWKEKIPPGLTHPQNWTKALSLKFGR